MAAYNITPGTNTFLIIYTSKDLTTYLAQTYARAGQNTVLGFEAGNVTSTTSFVDFNTALAAVGQPTSAFEPFEDSAPPAPGI